MFKENLIPPILSTTNYKKKSILVRFDFAPFCNVTSHNFDTRHQNFATQQKKINPQSLLVAKCSYKFLKKYVRCETQPSISPSPKCVKVGFNLNSLKNGSWLIE